MKIGIKGIGSIGKRYFKILDEIKGITPVRYDLDSNVDAVIICTPHFTHYELGKRILETGIPLLLEKPIALTSEQCQDLVDIADNIIFSTAFQLRFDDLYQQLKINPPNHIKWNVVQIRDDNYYRGWRSGSNCGLLMTQSIHQIDLLNWWYGMPKKITGEIYTHHHKIDVEDTANLLFYYNNSTCEFYSTTAPSDRSTCFVYDGIQRTSTQSNLHQKLILNFLNSILGCEELICPASCCIDAVKVIELIKQNTINKQKV